MRAEYGIGVTRIWVGRGKEGDGLCERNMRSALQEPR